MVEVQWGGRGLQFEFSRLNRSQVGIEVVECGQVQEEPIGGPGAVSKFEGKQFFWLQVPAARYGQPADR